MADGLVLHRGIAHGNCRSCKKPVVFAADRHTGKLAPFELDPAGHWTIVNGVAKFLGTPEPLQLQLGLALNPRPASEEPLPTRYTPHFASCPKAEKWRR